MRRNRDFSSHVLLALSFVLLTLACQAGWIEDKDDRTIIHVKLWALPDPTATDANSLSQVAVVKEFVRRFPDLFETKYRAKYEADPEKYGRHNWRNVEVELQKFSGITIENQGMDSAPLMAIAGGVSPDIIYVNFRQSDTYIQQRFLYPLDKPEDDYLLGMTEEEKSFQIHPKIWPVIKRRGPDGDTHVWAMPMGGVLGKVVLYRKDLLDSAGIPFPHNDWTWDDLFDACKRVTDPAKGTYGIMFGRGPHESWYWVTFLWSAEGEVMVYDEAADQWQATFDSRGAAEALDLYTLLCTEEWQDATGRKRYGYATKDTDRSTRWDLGQIAFNVSYIDEKLFSTINPDIVGMVPVPRGPQGGRGAELNSRMQGLFADIKDSAVRDAAWEYLKFGDSKDAVEIRTRILVEGGLGRFVNPRYLRLFDYDDIVRLAPKGWEECFSIAIDTGKPEPYGRNCQLVYEFMTKPLHRAEAMSMAGELPADREQRLDVLQGLLREAVKDANEKMIGRLSPEELRKRRITAVLVLCAIVVAFALVFRKICRAFTPPKIEGAQSQETWGFRKYAWGYCLLIPAVLSVFFWQYVPLFMGSKMALQDYQIMGGSTWVGVDNFGAVLWDLEWWNSVWNALRYSLLVISLTFLPPVILAVVLQEVPRGTIVFRTVFYLPAVITGLVVIYLWKSFYMPTEFGVLNAVVLSIPAVGYLAIGLLLFLVLFFFAKRLYIHQIYWVAGLCFLAGVLLFLFCYRFAHPIFVESPPWYRALFKTTQQPYRWLQDPETAMFCCVLPMVWAGMGPGCLIYLAALKGIADDFYEAADIDGATFIDKILFVVIPILRPLLIIQFVGIFIGAWKSSAFILAMTGGASNTTVAGLLIFYKAYMYLKFGPATAMAWVLGFMLIGFTVHQLQILSRLEFKTTGDKK